MDSFNQDTQSGMRQTGRCNCRRSWQSWSQVFDALQSNYLLNLIDPKWSDLIPVCTPGIRIRQFGRRSIWFPSALSEVEENSAPVVIACWGIDRPLCDQPTQIHIWLYHLPSIYQCTDPFSHIQPTLSLPRKLPIFWDQFRATPAPAGLLV